MSLYNMLFGVNRHADVLLAMLGLRRDDVPRFRDCYFDGNGRIVIHTRTGGGNREDYEEDNDRLTNIPTYLFDEDDDFDCTYANFTYSVPDEYKDAIAPLIESGTRDPAQAWQDLFAALQDPNDNPTKAHALAVTKPTMDKLMSFLHPTGERDHDHTD